MLQNIKSMKIMFVMQMTNEYHSFFFDYFLSINGINLLNLEIVPKIKFQNVNGMWQSMAMLGIFSIHIFAHQIY